MIGRSVGAMAVVVGGPCCDGIVTTLSLESSRC
jgi:hypothetical protein